MLPVDLWLGLAMASVLKLRRDMVVDESPEAAATAIDAGARADDGDTAEPAHGLTIVGHIKLWTGIAAGIAVLAAYPAMMVMASDTGNRKALDAIERSEWTAPWAGAAAGLLEIHFDATGWASDAPEWAPAARLTAKPALQSAVAETLGEFLMLKSHEAVTAGDRDSDLDAAARLLTGASTGVQVRAAFEALVSHDQRARRYAAAAAAPDGDSVAELTLVAQWASRSQSELAAAAGRAGDVIDPGATRAVFAAKGRAQAAYALIQSFGVQDDPRLELPRLAALDAWTAVAGFDPLVVLNASPDSPILGNHAASMGFLMTRAETATDAYRMAAARLSPASGTGITNVVSASILATDAVH